jgi:hypothetical protein
MIKRCGFLALRNPPERRTKVWPHLTCLKRRTKVWPHFVRWLERRGFAIGARYYVTAAQGKGKLMLTLAQPDGSDESMAE